MGREEELDPPDPVAALVEHDAFRKHPLVGFSAEQMPLRAALTLAPVTVRPSPDAALPPVVDVVRWEPTDPQIRGVAVAAQPFRAAPDPRTAG